MAEAAAAAASGRPTVLSPTTVREPESRNAARSKIFFETVRRLLTLAYQQAWKRQQDLANPGAPAVRPEGCPLKAEPLEDHPLWAEGWWPADDPDSEKRIQNDIIQWVAVRTINAPVLWDSLTGKMQVHWSQLPDGLPVPISRESQQEMWRCLFPDFRNLSLTTQQHIKVKRCWQFFRKNLQLYATLALAEKKAGTTTNEETAATTPKYRELAAQMDDNPALTLLAEKVATATASLTECERFYACLPTPTLAEPGHTQEIRQLREERQERLQREDPRVLAVQRELNHQDNELVDRSSTLDILLGFRQAGIPSPAKDAPEGRE